LNEVEKFYVDDFFNEVIHEINLHSYNKQEKFKVVYRMINNLMSKTQEINNTQLLTNGLVTLLGFLNNRPVDGFPGGNPLSSKEKQKVKELLYNEFIPN
jgi:hypothetical protein